MEKTFELGKINCLGYNNTDRKINAVEVTIAIRPNKFYQNGESWIDGKHFSVSGSVYNSKHTDCIIGGQILDELNDNYDDIRNNPLFIKIHRLWTLYHLKNIDDIPEDDMAEINALMEN